MARLYGRDWTKRELLERVGDVSQLGGARPITFAEGPEAGVAAVDVRTGSGFRFTVLPGRGLDLGLAEYNGAPLNWRSSTGEVAAAFYEREDQEWLRGFHGGMMVTCGLSTSGWPSTDEGKQLGLHGPASYLPARNVHVDGEWQGDDYVMWVQGRTRETVVYGEDLRLTRRVWARLGESRLFLDDVVENMAHEPVPHMMTYHVNPGFPVLDQGSELLFTRREVGPIDEESEAGKAARANLAQHARFDGPQAAWGTQVFNHTVRGDAEGNAYTAIVNRGFGGGRGLGLYVKQRIAELPYMWQWKQTGQGTYVLGMEPSNCHGLGRANERARGGLKMLAPGEQVRYHIEIGVLTSGEEITAFERRVAATG